MFRMPIGDILAELNRMESEGNVILPRNPDEIKNAVKVVLKSSGVLPASLITSASRRREFVIGLIDEEKNVLAMSIPKSRRLEKSKITTNSWGLNFREHIVSWDNDTLKLNYQGVDVMVMAGLSSFFMTPLGQPFFGAPAQMGAVQPVVNNFLITDVFVCNFDSPEGFNSPCCALDSGCGKFMYGNMQKSKWGFQTESQFV